MGCCVSNPTSAVNSQSEMSTPIHTPIHEENDLDNNNNTNTNTNNNTNNNNKTTSVFTTSEAPKMQKRHSHKKNTHPHQSEHTKKEDSKSYSSVNLESPRQDSHKLDFQEKIANIKQEQEANAKRLQELQHNALEEQVTRQRSKTFAGLYEIFEQNATNFDKTKMDIGGLTAALATFGMRIDSNRTLQKFVFSKFDIDNEKEIDYNDFMATLSSLIGTKNEDALLLMFQIFDIDEDGYLNIEDMALILLAQNQIAMVVTGHHTTRVSYTEKQCLKQARNMIAKYDNNNKLKDNKISFDEFYGMMMKRDTDDMMLDHMIQPSQSGINVNVNGINVNGTPIHDETPTYTYTGKQIQLVLPNKGDETLLEQ